MNFPDGLLSETWVWLAWPLWAGLLFLAIRRADWLDFRNSDRFNVWLGMIVVLTLMWSLKAEVQPGLSFHLLGAMVFTLCFGPALAYIGLNLVLFAVTLNGAAGMAAFAVNAVHLAGIGVALSASIHALVTRYLPRHFFIFIFVNAFFGAALTVLGVGLGVTSAMAFSGAYAVDYLFGEYFPYFLLLGFSEAWLSGMLVTLFVIYRPVWIASFEDERYLKRK